jgi:hypothetical protein
MSETSNPSCVYAVVRRQGQRESVAAVYAKEDDAKSYCRFRGDMAPDDVTYSWRVLEVQQEFRP